MATTYTANSRLQKPSSSDRYWDAPLNANADFLDGVSSIGGLAVTAIETPSSSLAVRVSAGSYVKADGTVGTFGGIESYALPPLSTLCLWLTDAGILSSSTAFPDSAHLRLAQVVIGSSAILTINDQRVGFQVTGNGLGFVLKSGDHVSGPLVVAPAASANFVFSADPNSATLAFFGATPAGPATALNALNDNSTGTPSDSIVDVGETYSQSIIDGNFSAMCAKINSLISAMKRHGLMAS